MKSEEIHMNNFDDIDLEGYDLFNDEEDFGDDSIEALLDCEDNLIFATTYEVESKEQSETDKISTEHIDVEWMDYSSDDYCKNECEFYKNCYANHSTCPKQVIKEYLQLRLPEREQTILKLKYGYKHEPASWREIANTIGLTESYLKNNLFKKAFGEIAKSPYPRRLNNGRNFFWFDVFNGFEDTFCSRLVTDIFNNFHYQESKTRDLKNEIRVGINYAVVIKSKCADKSIAEINQELNKNIENCDFLKEYLVFLKKADISTLYNLLCTSYLKLLEIFDNNDYIIYKLENDLRDNGYCFKRTNRCRDNIKKYRKSMLDKIKLFPEIPEQELKDSPLSVSVVLELYKHNICTLKELLLLNADQYKSNGIPEDIIQKIEQYKKNSGFFLNAPKYCIENTLFQENKISEFYEKLIEELYKNKFSIYSLCNDVNLEKMNSLEEKFDYIEQNYNGVSIMKIFNPLDKKTENEILLIETLECEKEKILSISIEDLDLSIRSYKCLKRAGINTVGELINFSMENLRKIRNLDRKSVEEIVYKLKVLGLTLRDENMTEQE